MKQERFVIQNLEIAIFRAGMMVIAAKTKGAKTEGA